MKDRLQVVYACSKVKHLPFLHRSVQSIRIHLPDACVRLYVTIEVHRQIEGWMFDEVFLIEPRYQHRPRFDAMFCVPFGKTLFLDCDTLAIAPLEPLFEALDVCDIALCPAINHLHPEGLQQGIYSLLDRVPECFGEWNGGVMVARVGTSFREFARKWASSYELCHARGYYMDQAALRSTIWHWCSFWGAGMRPAALRNNYNFRTMAAQAVVGEVKILHGKGDLESVAARINLSTEYRLFEPTPEEAGLV